MFLTAEKAYALHIQMWSDMQETLGDNPDYETRYNFRRRWCDSRGYGGMGNYCFLCEYVDGHDKNCSECIVDWSGLTEEKSDIDCMSCYKDSGGSIYEDAPISEILALPIKEEYRKQFENANDIISRSEVLKFLSKFVSYNDDGEQIFEANPDEIFIGLKELPRIKITGDEIECAEAVALDRKTISSLRENNNE